MGRHSCSSSLIILVAALAALQAHAEVELKPLEDLHQHTGDDPRPLEDLNNGTGGNNGTEGVQYIVGGKPTSANKFPWQMLVMTRKVNGLKYRCGGSVISQTWIMSAAHCFADTVSPEGFTVTARRIYLYAGATDYRKINTDPNVQRHVIDRVGFKKQLFIYPNYNKGGEKYNDDIALIKLKKPLTKTKSVNPIPLATTADFIPGKKLTVSGWGRTSPSGPTATILQYVNDLNLLSQKECVNVWSPLGYDVTDRQICQKTRNKNTCGGDSGGPVITGSGNSNGPPFIQIGIVSLASDPCGRYPDIYTNVANFTKWIDNTMSGRSFKCESAGIFPNRDNCRKFILCMAIGGGRYRKFTMTCPANLYFNPGIDVCDHPGNVATC